jgi:hypothetical protein
MQPAPAATIDALSTSRFSFGKRIRVGGLRDARHWLCQLVLTLTTICFRDLTGFSNADVTGDASYFPCCSIWCRILSALTKHGCRLRTVHVDDVQVVAADPPDACGVLLRRYTRANGTATMVLVRQGLRDRNCSGAASLASVRAAGADGGECCKQLQLRT